MKTLTLLLLLLITIPSSKTFYVFSSSNCESCVSRLNLAEELHPDYEFIVYDISQEPSLTLFFEVERSLNISFTPLPLFLMFTDGNLSLIAAGGLSREAWLALKTDENLVNVYVDNGRGEATLAKSITRKEASKIGEIISNGGALPREVDPVLIISAALLDALNPCMLGFFLILLTLLSYSKNTLSSGLSFITAVYATRIAIGIGLIQLLRIPQLKLIVFSIAFILGFIKALQSVLGGRQIPAIVMEKITIQVERASNPASSFLAGVVSSTLIATCASPAYMLALNLIQSRGIVPLLIYNLVIIAPLLILTASLYNVNRLRRSISGKRRIIDFLTGIGIMAITLLSL